MNKEKKVRLYVNGKRYKDIYPHATKWEVFKFKVRKLFVNILFWGMIAGIIFGIFKLGGVLNPATIYTTAEVIKEVPIQAPVLERIAKCESGGSQFDKNGQLTLNGNKDGSVDIGKFQINNKYWGKKAKELGYDLTKEKDNEAFAQYLYTNYGTDAWVWSKKCWNK